MANMTEKDRREGDGFCYNYDYSEEDHFSEDLNLVEGEEEDELEKDEYDDFWDESERHRFVRRPSKRIRMQDCQVWVESVQSRKRTCRVLQQVDRPKVYLVHLQE